jgi:hypothetical protein
LLAHPAPALHIGRRRAEQVTAAAISEVVHVKDALSWYLGALGELHAALSAQRVIPSGSAGGIFSNAIFSHAHGEATVFIPCGDMVRSIGRVSPRIVPAVELATLVHKGSHAEIDIAYGSRRITRPQAAHHNEPKMTNALSSPIVTSGFATALPRTSLHARLHLRTAGLRLTNHLRRDARFSR